MPTFASHTLPLQSHLNQVHINHCHGAAYSWPSWDTPAIKVEDMTRCCAAHSLSLPLSLCLCACVRVSSNEYLTNVSREEWVKEDSAAVYSSSPTSLYIVLHSRRRCLVWLPFTQPFQKSPHPTHCSPPPSRHEWHVKDLTNFFRQGLCWRSYSHIAGNTAAPMEEENQHLRVQ